MIINCVNLHGLVLCSLPKPATDWKSDPGGGYWYLRLYRLPSLNVEFDTYVMDVSDRLFWEQWSFVLWLLPAEIAGAAYAYISRYFLNWELNCA